MKRRRWWFIGLALALLAACVFAWNVDERPPYQFLKGARLSEFSARIGSTSCRLTYVSSRSADQFRPAAEREAKGGAWISVNGGAAHLEPGSTERDVFILTLRSNLLDYEKPVPQEARTVIWVYRNATLGDRVRHLIYGLRP